MITKNDNCTHPLDCKGNADGEAQNQTSMVGAAALYQGPLHTTYEPGHQLLNLVTPGRPLVSTIWHPNINVSVRGLQRKH